MLSTPLDQLCSSVFTGIPPRLKAVNATVQTLELPVAGIRAISPQGALLVGQLESIVVLTSSVEINRALRPGDVLLTIRGSLPKCGLVECDFANATYASGNLVVLRPNPALIEPAYLWAVLLRISRSPNHPLLTRATTGQLSIRLGDLVALKITTPSLAVQKEIGEASIALRNAVAAQQAALEQGERTLNAFLSEVVL